jgi:hypothetical protein
LFVGFLGIQKWLKTLSFYRVVRWISWYTEVVKNIVISTIKGKEQKIKGYSVYFSQRKCEGARGGLRWPAL